jgi:hypothetical protein
LFNPGTNGFTTIRETLFADDSGWIAMSPIAWGSTPVSHQKLKDGRYLFLAVKSTESTTSASTLFTVNLSTKQIVKFPTTPDLPALGQTTASS